MSDITVTDQFCGSGGSSIGAELAGAKLRLGLNHWPLAIDTHNTNFPNADHDCTDISACDPRRYPSTDILITSPECTNHSLAKGKIRKWQSQIDMFGTLDLESEYSEKAAQASAARAAQRRRIANQRLALEAEPISSEAELAAAVERLNTAFRGERVKPRKKVKR